MTVHNEYVKTHDVPVTVNVEHVTAHDVHVIVHDKHVTAHDEHVTAHDEHVAAHDEHVTAHDEHVTAHDEHVTAHVVLCCYCRMEKEELMLKCDHLLKVKYIQKVEVTAMQRSSSVCIYYMSVYVLWRNSCSVLTVCCSVYVGSRCAKTRAG